MEAAWIALASTLFWLGAEGMLRGVVDLGRAARLSDTAIGLGLVGFAQSGPAFAVMAVAALSGKAELAAGGVLTAAIAQLTGVLGLCAVFRPLQTERRAALRGAITMGIAALYVVWLCFANARAMRGFGFVGLVLIAAALLWNLRLRRADNGEADHTWRAPILIEKASRTAFSLIGVFILLGGAALYAGARIALAAVGELAAMGTPTAHGLAIGLLALALSVPGAAAMASQALNKRGLHLGQVIARPTYSVMGGFCLLALLGPTALETLAPFAFALLVTIGIAGGVWTYGAGLSRRDGLLLIVCFLGFAVWFGARA